MSVQPMTQKPAPASDPQSEMDVLRVLGMLSRHWRLLAVLCAVCLAAAGVLYVITPKQYRSATTLQIEPRNLGLTAIEDLFRSEGANRDYYQTQYRLLQSRGMAERVVTGLSLQDEPAFNPPRASMLEEGDEPSEAPTQAADALVLAGLAQRLLGGLEVRPIPNTQLVEVAYVAATPDLATRITAGFAEAFIDWSTEKSSTTVGKASNFLSAQIQTLKQEIAEKETQFQAYSRSNDIVAMDGESNVPLQRLEALNRDYSAAVSERIQKESRYRELQSSTDPAATAEALGGEGTSQLQDELTRLERDYANKLATYKPDWPAMRELKGQIDKVRQSLTVAIQEAVSKAREAARTEFQTVQRREQLLAAELARQKLEVMDLNSAAVEYNNLKVEVSTRRALLDELLRKQSETEVAARLEGSRDSNILIVDRALPGTLWRPSLQRNLGFGLLAGLLLGLVAAFLAEALDRTLKTYEEVERLLQLPVLAVISELGTGSGRRGYGYGGGHGYGRPTAKKTPQDPDETRIELLPARHPNLPVSEAYRSLRTALLLSTAGGLRRVVVSSALSGEGKTATSVNLAVVMAQLGRRVLLVDCDLRKPRLHSIFEVHEQVGLVGHLTSELGWQQAVLRTQVPNLFLLPCGPIPPNPSELLASGRMRAFVAAASEQFDFLVFDSPPLLPVADAILIGALADGLVYCLRAGTVAREDALACRDRLLNAEVKVLGTVLNRFKMRWGRYGGSYRYQAYTEHRDDADSSAA